MIEGERLTFKKKDEKILLIIKLIFMIKIYHPLPDFTHLGYNFGDETSTNKLLYKRPHSGIDYNWGATARADYGKPFFAIADGVVVFEGLLPDWGRLAVIWHPDLGVWSRYGHQKTFLYKKGDVVKGGEELGKIGDGEGKFSPHLHFCVIKKELPHWGAYRCYFRGLSDC